MYIVLKKNLKSGKKFSQILDISLIIIRTAKNLCEIIRCVNVHSTVMYKGECLYVVSEQ